MRRTADELCRLRAHHCGMCWKTQVVRGRLARGAGRGLRRSHATCSVCAPHSLLRAGGEWTCAAGAHVEAACPPVVRHRSKTCRKSTAGTRRAGLSNQDERARLLRGPHEVRDQLRRDRQQLADVQGSLSPRTHLTCRRRGQSVTPWPPSLV
jgi:hypothetical protein